METRSALGIKSADGVMALLRFVSGCRSVELRITFVMLCSLAFITLASEVTQAGSLSKKEAPQISSEEIFAAEKRLTDLFIVDTTGTITHILPVCTGNEKLYVDHGQIHRAHTPRGTFKVVRKIAGWRLSSLGLLYYPNYIHNGIAIHGSPAMAVYPASHGCIRIPMFASKKLSELTPVGTEVIIYD